MMIISYLLISILFVIYSWGFVDIHSPFPIVQTLYDFIHTYRGWATMVYCVLFVALFVLYMRTLWLVKKNQLSLSTLLIIISLCVCVLYFGFPGFSYDVFNYMATARMTFLHHENPYIVMPIEIPNEPMLQFMHAANKVALYGPVWILMTFIPYLLGSGNLLMTIFTFKLFVILFYGGFLYVLWDMSGRNLFSLAFFALNPIVLSETLLSGHNDIVMMFLALTAFYFLREKKVLLSIILFICSILIKYATLTLLPIYVYVWWKTIKREKIIWYTIWMWSALAMYIAFLLSPLREEVYAWYFIWPLAFVALLKNDSFLVYIAYGFSLGLPYRFSPFIYWEQWGGMTPMIKKIVTSLPPVFTTGIYVYTKKLR